MAFEKIDPDAGVHNDHILLFLISPRFPAHFTLNVINLPMCIEQGHTGRDRKKFASMKNQRLNRRQ